MSYVFVETEHPNESTLETHPFVSYLNNSPENDSSTTLSSKRENVITGEDRSPSNVIDITTLIEIPDSCVEYIGKLMTGEIVEATVIDRMNVNEWKDIIITYEDKPSPVHPDGVLRRHPDTPALRSNPQTPTLTDSLTPRSRAVADIHCCECIAVFSCCFFT
jgi:hypothetical protein